MAHQCRIREADLRARRRHYCGVAVGVAVVRLLWERTAFRMAVLVVPEHAAAGGSGKRHRLAQRRKALGLTQETLADLLGAGRSTVVRWERGESEPLPWIRPKLARALKVSADRLGEMLEFGSPADPGGAPRKAVSVPRQLPAAVADFTGRGAELAALTRMLDEARTGAAGTVVISAIGGTAGVGKTALPQPAVRAGRRRPCPAGQPGRAQPRRGRAAADRPAWRVAWCHCLLGDYQRAVPLCRQALTLHAEIGNRDLDAAIWDSLGHAEHHLGNLPEATACYQRALSIFRELGDRYSEALILAHLGDTRRADRELAQARAAWEQALAILEDMRLPDADEVRAKLANVAD